MKLLLQIFKMEISEFHVLIKHCFLLGKILFYESNGLISVIWTLLHWKQWLRGGMLTLNMVVQTQMMLNTQVTQIQQLSWKTPKNSTNFVSADPKLKLCEMIEEQKISESSVFTILHEHLSMSKLCSKWVPCLFTVDQKQQCVSNSERCLQLFQCNKKEFLYKYVTMDKTWIHQLTLESNWQSAEWTAAGEGHPKRPKMQTSACKVLASVFWDVQGILLINYLEKGRTINSEYCIALLVHLKEEIAENGHKWRKKFSFSKTMHCVTSWSQW